MRRLQFFNQKGFTVVELVTVIVVIGILASAAIVGYGAWRKQVTTSVVQNDLSSALAAMESARNFGAGYPTSIPKTANSAEGVTLSYILGDSKSFCIEAKSKQYSDVSFYVDTAQGKTIQAGTCLGGPLYDSQYTAFVYDTTLPDCTSLVVQLPFSNPSSAPGATINWGDGTTSSLTTSLQSHTFPAEGKYTVLYNGPINHINTSGIASDRTPCLSKVSQWGNSAQPTVLRFQNSKNLTYVAKPPSSITNMDSAFWNATSFNQPINDWDVSNVTTLSRAFANASSFNQPLDNWDTGSVTTLNETFNQAKVFNQPIGSWDISNVTNLRLTFLGAEAFNQPLNSWNTSSVTSMHGTFGKEACGCPGARSFNQPLNNWNTSNVTDMSWMFNDAIAFNQNINNWNLSNVTNIEQMFAGATSFNQPVNSWDTSKVTSMTQTFAGATVFNQPLSNWNTSNVTSMHQMFHSASAFNQPLNTFNTSKVTSMVRMFREATSFNQPLNNWNTSSVTTIWQMFQNTPFSQNISMWNVANVNDRSGAAINDYIGKTLPAGYYPLVP